MQRLPARKLVKVVLISAAAVLGMALILGVGYVVWPGPDTTVVNDSARTVMLNNCGDIASQIPPGDVYTVKPGGKVVISSNAHQPGNSCNVYYGAAAVPTACLPLPRGGETRLTERLRPVTTSDLGCDYYKF